MNEFIVISPCYEILRYGHDKTKKQVADIHAQGKRAKFVITSFDLIDPKKPPTKDNFKFEACQAEVADIVLYVDEKGITTRLFSDDELCMDYGSKFCAKKLIGKQAVCRNQVCYRDRSVWQQ
jgi:hypothetical protein